uniref:Uncharacterized protein n=1 Tax=Pithovirus LCPAC401 TaxID=2506595 RepID=A0A481ZA17_9VIRU|nr:MAG: hypothetical protein LCPAC401_03820 [Pithovirus LCPAC401]
MENCDPQIDGMYYTLPKDALMFLDRKNSPLITRIGKESDQYKKLFADYTESRIARNIELDICDFKYR